MAEPVERLVNLAIYLAATPVPVTAEQIRTNVEGYSPDQDTDAFLRMFERDKEDLRDAGFVIHSSEDAYRIDRSTSFASRIELSPEDAAAVRAVGLAFVDDPSFPFAESLRLALAKIATAFDAPDLPVTSHLADESPASQGELVAQFDHAISARKRVTFGYTNSYGEQKHHEVEPYGVFVLDGRWYAVGRDTEKDEVRVYAVARIEELSVNRAKPKSPDFERPTDFDVGTFIGLPFQYGAEQFEAVLRFDPATAWRADVLSAGTGKLERAPDGSVSWTVAARSSRRLARWLIENGPGIRALEPADLLVMLRSGLEEVASANA
jgi:proteasome accessory factor B